MNSNEKMILSTLSLHRAIIVIILTVMWAEKRYNDSTPWSQTSAQTSKNNSQLTPRSKLKPNVPLPNTRRSITPSRMQERVNTSPLRVPL